MKKFIVFLAVILILSSFFTVGASAESTSGESVDSGMAALFASAVSDAEKDVLFNRSYYGDSMTLAVTERDILFKYYCVNYWEEVGKTLDEITRSATEKQNVSYWVIRENMDTFRVTPRTYHGVTTVTKSYDGDTTPDFIKDLINMKPDTQFCGVDCRIEGIVCFDDFWRTEREIVLFFETDRGIFVRVYDSYPTSYLDGSKYVELTEEDFAVSARGFSEFLDAAHTKIEYLGTNGPDPALFGKYYADPEADEFSTTPTGYIVLGAIAVLVIAAATVFAVILIKKRKNNVEGRPEIPREKKWLFTVNRIQLVLNIALVALYCTIEFGGGWISGRFVSFFHLIGWGTTLMERYITRLLTLVLLVAVVGLWETASKKKLLEKREHIRVAVYLAIGVVLFLVRRFWTSLI